MKLRFKIFNVSIIYAFDFNIPLLYYFSDFSPLCLNFQPIPHHNFWKCFDSVILNLDYPAKHWRVYKAFDPNSKLPNLQGKERRGLNASFLNLWLFTRHLWWHFDSIKPYLAYCFFEVDITMCTCNFQLALPRDCLLRWSCFMSSE